MDGKAISPGDIVIPVMGMTGSGKSTFISLCTGEEAEDQSHQLTSGWLGVTIHTFRHYDKTIHLIKTPGFGSTERDEEEIFEEWIYWLLKAYESDLKVTGLVYTHRIDEPRFTGSQSRGLEIFKKMCGASNYPAIVMATTAWNRATREEGEARVSELVAKEHFWGDLHRGGAHVEPMYDGDRRSALRIINLLLGHVPGHILEIQRQIVEDSLLLHETAAGQILYSGWLSEKDRLEKGKLEVRDALKSRLDAIYTTQLTEFENGIQQINSKLKRISESGKERIISIWEIRIRDDLRWIDNELTRSQVYLQSLEDGLTQTLSTQQADDGSLRKDFEKEVAEMRKRIQRLQRTRGSRVETYEIAIVGVKVAATVASAVVPALACTIM